MSNVPILEPEAASPEVAAVYSDFQKRMGFPAPPNFIKAQGHSLAAATGTWGLVQNVLVKGEIPRTLKEMLFVVISKQRNCRYCEAAHLACCRMLGVEPATLDTLVSNIDEISPTKARRILEFGLRCAQDPQSLGPADFQSLEEHGLSRSEIVETIAMSALAVYANIMADATGVPPDQMFGDF